MGHHDLGAPGPPGAPTTYELDDLIVDIQWVIRITRWRAEEVRQVIERIERYIHEHDSQ